MKRDSGREEFLWSYRNSSEHFFKEHLPATFSKGWSKMPRMLFFPMDLSHLFPRGFLPACSRLTRKTLEKGVKELCSKFTIKNRATSLWYCYGVFIVDFEHWPATLLKKRPWHILHLFLVFLLLTLNSKIFGGHKFQKCMFTISNINILCL